MDRASSAELQSQINAQLQQIKAGHARKRELELAVQQAKQRNAERQEQLNKLRKDGVEKREKALEVAKGRETRDTRTDDLCVW